MNSWRLWSLAALFGSLPWWWLYPRYGQGGKDQRHEKASFPVMSWAVASHCGAGCILGDICAEWPAFFFPAITVWLGWTSLFNEKIYAAWVPDYCFAYAFGIIFQYFTIAPMRHLSLWQGI